MTATSEPVFFNPLEPGYIENPWPHLAQLRAADPVQQLSGGEMQRVAICRALLRRPEVLLADEPTGNLDDETGRRVMDLLLTLTREEGNTLLYVTHSREAAGRADEVWRIHSGELDALS